MVQPFEVAWSDEAVQAVLDQIRAYPWPPIPEVPDGWAYGCDGAYLKELCAHWTGAYDWRAAMAFANLVSDLANEVDHHPDLLVGWGRCRVAWSTHDAGGITGNDLACAARTETIAVRAGAKASG